MSKQIFKSLEPYRHILVTGPQRSGTTICAAMLAYSHGKAFLPDEEIGQNDVGRLKSIIGKSEFVLQCPALLPQIHTLDFEDTAIVLMWRDTGDINASIERIEWEGGKEEIERYQMANLFDRTIWESWLIAFKVSSKAIAAYKYQMWTNIQRPICKMPVFDLGYNSLHWHPLWIKKSERRNFEPRQISHEHANATQERISGF